MTQQEKLLWYKEKKRFGFVILPIYKKNEFDKAVQVLKFQKADFVFIHNRLNHNDRLEFKNDYCDQLEKLKHLQQYSKYKELIEKQLQEVNSRYDNFKPKSHKLQQYYNCVIRVDYFKKHLDSKDELYYRKAIKDWKNYRNENLIKHDTLSIRKGWLVPFNNRLATLMNKIVSNFESVIESRELQTDLHPNDFEIVLGKHLQPLKRMVTGFKMNYDSDKLLAYEMQQYCINGFDLMLIFIKDELLIRIENAPYFQKIQDVINEYKNAIDVESVKLSLNNKPIKKEPQQDSQFSVLEWATIFYYADETKLLPENKYLKNRIEQFMDFHKIPTTFKSFKSKYHTAKNRINKNNNYPIDKLELISPFLEKNYKQAVTLIDRDINFLLSEKSEYQ